MTAWTLIIGFIKERFYSYYAFILGFIIILWPTFKIDSYINLFQNTHNHSPLLYIIIPPFVLYLLLAFCWSILWLKIKFYLPRNKKNHIGLIISINTENNKQKIRLKNDLIERLKYSISDNNLTVINIIVLNERQSNRVTDILNAYKNANNTSKTVKQLEKIRRRIHPHFFVWGSIKERMHSERTYFINLNGLVIHRNVDNLTQEKIERQ